MRGNVTVSGEVVLSLRVLGEEGGSTEIVQAAIDTGFDGHLLLPPFLVGALSLPRIGSTRPTLADGSTITLSVHAARVMWHDQPRPVRVLVADSNPLIGTAMLRGSRLTVDFVSGGGVAVQELP